MTRCQCAAQLNTSVAENYATSDFVATKYSADFKAAELRSDIFRDRQIAMLEERVVGDFRCERFR
jgi:hypothetical protein